jgi:hypothetical protein
MAALLDPSGEDEVSEDTEEVLAIETCLLDLAQGADRLRFPGDRHSLRTIATVRLVGRPQSRARSKRVGHERRAAAYS